MSTVSILIVVIVVFLPVATAAAVDSTVTPIGPGGLGFWNRLGYELGLPVASVVVPGVGQWGQGEAVAGWAFFGAWLTGAAMSGVDVDEDVPDDGLPRTWEAQVEELGLQLAFDAGLLSAYDSFRLSLPKLRVGGHYEFIERPTPTSAALASPFKFGFLKHKRTWIYLAIPVGIVVGVAIDKDGERLGYKVHDAVYTGGVALGSGVTEEAFFRGYLYPWFNRLWGERVWWANATQALLFGAVHLGSVDVPVVQTLGGFYWGWVVKNSEWDFQETIFQHFWWNAILITGALLFDDGNATAELRLPVIRF